MKKKLKLLGYYTKFFQCVINALNLLDPRNKSGIGTYEFSWFWDLFDNILVLPIADLEILNEGEGCTLE